MQQSERIELIKATVELVKLQDFPENVFVLDVFENIYSYLQLKLEAANDTKNK